MKKYLTGLLLIFSVSWPAAVQAAASDVLITSVQTESVTSANEEYITITNNKLSTVDVTGWHIQYFAANAVNFNSPSRSIGLSGTLAPHTSFMAATTGYKTSEAQLAFSAGLAAAGGHIRLISGVGTSLVQHDVFGWGTAALPETSAAPAATKGQSYDRKKGNDGLYVDTDNNAQDFTSGQPATVTTPAPATTGDNNDGSANASPDPVPVTVGSAVAQLDITELLPDPAAPATDANDEFVELYNPNTETVNLSGFKLQTGNTYSYSYIFTEGSLASGEHKAFYASQTKLTLSNTSGQARLLAANGDTISSTPAYSKAPTGSSWALYNGVWGWTTVPTPNATNTAVIQDPEAAAAAAKAATKISTKAAPKAKAATSSTKKASTAKPKATTTTSQAYKNPTSDNRALPVNPLLLALVAVPLLGYMVYEYRHDLANFIAKRRRNRSRRGQIGPEPARRGSY